MSEVNPHHPVTEALHDQWHKICLILMVRLGEKEIVINKADLDQVLEGPYKYIVAHDKHDGLHVILCDEAEAREALRRSQH